MAYDPDKDKKLVGLREWRRHERNVMLLEDTIAGVIILALGVLAVVVMQAGFGIW